jgi:hypothetical protein
MNLRLARTLRSLLHFDSSPLSAMISSGSFAISRSSGDIASK